MAPGLRGTDFERTRCIWGYQCGFVEESFCALGDEVERVGRGVGEGDWEGSGSWSRVCHR